MKFLLRLGSKHFNNSIGFEQISLCGIIYAYGILDPRLSETSEFRPCFPPRMMPTNQISSMRTVLEFWVSQRHFFAYYDEKSMFD